MARTSSVCKSIRDHAWEETPRAKRPSAVHTGMTVPQRCTRCETPYPCVHACRHHDCMMERGEPLPDWVTVEGYVPTKAAPTPVSPPSTPIRDYLSEMDELA